MTDDARPRRHDLVRLGPGARVALVPAAGALHAERTLLEDWSRRGRPFVVRRGTVLDDDIVPLGLALPPGDGRRRLSLSVARTAIVSLTPPLALAEARGAAPVAWRPTIDAILETAAHRGEDVRCYGSLAWAALTGLEYLTPSSDLDLLLYPRDGGEIDVLLTGLAALEAISPMRLDGELVRPDGAAANWREILGGSDDVLVKSQDAVALWRRHRFLAFRA